MNFSDVHQYNTSSYLLRYCVHLQCSWGSKPTPPGSSTNPLPPPVIRQLPGISAMGLAMYERQVALARMTGMQTLMQHQGQRIGVASQVLYDGGIASPQPPVYY